MPAPPIFGPVLDEGGVTFSLWAPSKPDVRLKIEDRAPMAMLRHDDGWHRLRVEGVGAGARYRFQIGDLLVPDPGSRFQPEDVHGPSEVIDTGFSWKAGDWRGLPWEETIFYELHIGTFSPEGSFRGAMDRLDHLVELGVTALQIMPLADFHGLRNWGYDGVLPYAPDSSYGRPEDLAALVDAAHERGMQVFLDVVYNHLGPEGNYLPAYSPFLTDRHSTAWGDAINYDGGDARPVREWAIGNAMFWLETYRFDGLRFDAVHAIEDTSGEHLLVEMARRIRKTFVDRHIHLVVENEENDPALLERNGDGTAALYNGQWNDDIHHVLHVAASGENFGYYADYQAGAGAIGKALCEGFVYQGEHMPHRGSPRGSSSAHLPPTAFISFIQNHDQVGNRAFGERITEIAPAPALSALAAIYLLAPQIPMIFMGEEWAASSPFPFFCDMGDELNGLIREGRLKEMAGLPGFDGDAGSLPDPITEETFLSAKLDWDERLHPAHALRLQLYKELIALRKRKIVPRLAGMGGHAGRANASNEILHVEWWLADGSLLSLYANLTDEARLVPEAPDGDILWSNVEWNEGQMRPWMVVWALQEMT
ncbi:malto-oligosyltrehalose trehalohydrolase [Allorhizobium undicola]|uniref:malto-oligosyltrehalose trehalohydrolase n=1 Tax=Allorhizobium undicola TaxID=78527 RepID=UPI0005697D77|nr:malto-oligosyltrehalose trehalohydrolase [Allorhizobium undicola]